MLESDDIQVWQRWRAGNHERGAIDGLLARHSAKLMQHRVHLTDGTERARDLYQETVCALLAQAPDIQRRCSLYLLRMATNLWLNRR